MFIDRLNEALMKKNISGNALCKKLGIPNANYTNWKKQTPKGETIKLIADALEVSTDWLLERDRAPEPDEIHLLENYRICDDAGKESIISIAELQAKRCRQEEMKPFA